MPARPPSDAELPDGDILVSPRYLACSTAIGDPALQPMLDLGWELRHDDLGNAYVSSPDQRIRVGYMPEGEDNALWRITAYQDVFASPRWACTFSDMAPTEFVTAVTTVLAKVHTDGPEHYLRNYPWQTYKSVAPLVSANWSRQAALQQVSFTAPDNLAGLVYDRRALGHERELTTNDTRWYLWGGPKGYYRWYGTFSTHTPAHIVTAATTAVVDPTPVARWNAEVYGPLRAHAEITPIAPRPAPTPTPLDIHRAHVAHARTIPNAASTLRWSTTSPPRRRSPAPPEQRIRTR
ncbi:DUF317 domain-containing protein [Streptomyces phyllanthi]|nr:DUF317 domain-containing protein [Streptomyces phyllanthi]